MRTKTAAVALLCALVWPPFPGDTQTQWRRVEIDGVSVCQDESGITFRPPYDKKSAVTMGCNTLTSFSGWLSEFFGGLSLVEAQFMLLSAPVDLPPSIPAGWTEGEYFGSADPHTSGTTTFVAPGTFTNTNIDGRFYFTDDSGAHWLYTPAAADDFTVTVRVDSLNIANSAKAFLQVRDENAANSAHASVEIDPSGFIGVQRVTTAGQTSVPFGPVGTAATGACLRISNDGSQDSILLEYAPDDGAANDCSNPTYVVLGQVFASWASTNDTKYVAMGCASTSPIRPTQSTCSFSAVSVSTAAVTHSAGQATVGWNPTSYCNPPSLCDEDVGTITLTATLTGTNTAGCTLFVNTVPGTALGGGTDYTNISNAVLTWPPGETGDRTQNLTPANRAGVQSPANRGLTVVLTKNTCTDPTLVNATANVTIRDDDGAVPGTGVIFSANSECKATVSGATEAIKDANCILADWGDPSDPGSDNGTSQLCIPPTPGFNEAWTDPDCAHPDVYAYLSNDSANGGPSAARAGTYFLKLRKAGDQIGGYWAAQRGDGTENRGMVQNPPLANCVQREPCWIGFSIWVPSSYTGESILQAVHQIDPMPSIDFFEIVNGQMRVRVRHSDNPNCCTYEAPNRWFDMGPTTEPGLTLTFISTGTTSRTFPTDQWVDIVKKITFDERAGGVGEYDVYVNGALEINYDGPVGFTFAAGSISGYAWWGSYRVPSDTSTIVTYIDEIRMGHESLGASFVDVDPESYD